MELNHLSFFHTVARHGSITKAAESIGISQPAVSKQIKQLERSLAVKLFERSGRGVQITEQGKLLSEFTRKIFGLIEEAENSLNDVNGLRRGRLAIGAGTTIGVYLLPEALVRFRQQFPGITLQLEVGNTSLLRDRIRNRSIDFALTEISLPSPEFDSTLFMSDDLVAIVPRSHHMARRKQVVAASIANEPFVVRESGSGTRSLVERVFARQGLKVQPVIALSSTEAVKRAVAAGLGVSIVSKMSVGSEVAAGNLVAIKLKDVQLRRPIYLVRLKNHRHSKAAVAFLDLLDQVVHGKVAKLPSKFATPVLSK